MKKLYIIAALLMATSAANAGNSISFEIEGHKIRIEAPNNCDSLSCIQVSAPSLSGSGFKSTKSLRTVSTTMTSRHQPIDHRRNPHPSSQRLRRNPASLRPTASRPLRRWLPPNPQRLLPPTRFPRRRLRLRRPRRNRSPSLPRRQRRSAYGPPKKTRAWFVSRHADKTFADIRSRPARRFSST